MYTLVKLDLMDSAIHEAQTIARAMKLVVLAGESSLAPEDARNAVREAAPYLEGLSRTAAAIVLGELGAELPVLPRRTAGERLLDTIAHVWWGWINQRHREVSWRAHAAQGLALALDEAKKEGEGLIQVMTLRLVAEALGHLLQNELDLGKRRWQQALELGAHHGIESQLDLNWMFAATLIMARQTG